MRTIPRALAAAAFLLVATVDGVDATNPSDLIDTAWTLSALPGRDLVAGSQVTLTFADGFAHGSDGCNRYRAPYTVDDAGFRLSGETATTMMACAEPLMQQAAAFADALSGARAVRTNEGRLVLLDAGGGTLATFARQSRDLAGTAWRVTGYNNGKQAVVSVRDGTTLTMAFTADGSLGGAAGCNTYRAAYSLSGTSVAIGAVATTRKMCAQPDGVMDQEAAFLAALEGATVLQIDGDRLELRSDGGALMVTATRQPGAEPPNR
jgi:heat shock protein HslJ